MTKYLSLTLGPITRTINLAESTKELWAASYFFSYLAKKIIEPFTKGEHKRDFLMPIVDNADIWKPHFGAGLFSDRYIFESQEKDFNYMTEHVDQVLLEISRELVNMISPTPCASKVYAFLKSFLKIYFFEKSFNATDNTKEHIISECERYMNLIENQDAFPEKEDEHFLQTLFKNVNGKPTWNENHEITGFKGSFLSKDAYGNDSNGRLFSSIMEISATEKGAGFLQEIVTIEYEIEEVKEKRRKEKNSEKTAGLKTELKTLEEEHKRLLGRLFPYQKYIAIVKADGDNIGKAKKELGNEATKIINEAFLEFNLSVVDIISNHQGKSVFVGGDDLLFFAPVYCDGETIFDLIKQIDDCFHQKFEGKLPEDKRPTFSFGVSITYHKFPMFEALDNADCLLFGKAKNGELTSSLLSKGISGNELDFIAKNNLAFTIQKHSGQVITTKLNKGNKDSYVKFLGVIKKYVNPNAQKDKDKQEQKDSFLASVMHKLKDYESMFNFILKNADSEKLLKNFFDNNFNEPVHEQYRGLIADIQDLLLKSYREIYLKAEAFNENINSLINLTEKDRTDLCIDSVKEAINQVYATLRFIHFINSTRNE